MPQVLLFNIASDKRRKIRFLLMKLGIACREIPAQDFGKPLGALAGYDGYAQENESEAYEPFSSEMLVMDGLNPAQFQGLLEGLRRERAAVSLKAVVTEHNLGWTAAQLHKELSAEREAMKKAAGQSIHQGANAEEPQKS